MDGEPSESVDILRDRVVIQGKIIDNIGKEL